MNTQRSSEPAVPARSDAELEVGLMSRKAGHSMTTGRRVELQGLLGAIGWGLDDKVNRAALFTKKERVYEVVVTDETADLLRHLRCVVHVEGELTESAEGMTAVRVDTYHIVE